MKRTRNNNLTDFQKEIRDNYSAWKIGREKRGIKIHVTRAEFCDLWEESGLFNQRGLGQGQSTIWFSDDITDVYVTDCKVILRDIVPVVIKIKQKSKRQIAIEEAEIRRQIRQAKKASKPAKPAKKPYRKSDDQILKEIMTAKRKLEEAKANESTEIDPAVLKKDSPFQRRIDEIASTPYTNYAVYNLRTKLKLHQKAYHSNAKVVKA